MEQINKIELQGFIGSVRLFETSGKQAIQFSLATNHSFKSNEGYMVIETTWHNVLYWASNNDDLSGFEKGTPVKVIGRLRMKRYSDSQGSDRFTYEVIAHSINKIIE